MIDDPLDRFIAWAMLAINMRQATTAQIADHKVIEL